MARGSAALARVGWSAAVGPAVALLLLILDQATKRFAQSLLVIGPEGMPVDWAARVPLLSVRGIMLDVTHVANAGVTFGLLERRHHGLATLLFYLATAAAMGASCYVLARCRHQAARLSGGLALAGLVGNLIDRVRLGYVVDWLEVRALVAGQLTTAPTFNLADLWLVAAALLLVADWIRSRLGQTRAPGSNHSHQDDSEGPGRAEQPQGTLVGHVSRDDARTAEHCSVPADVQRDGPRVRQHEHRGEP